MLFDQEVANIFTSQLLRIQAIKLNYKQPFTWASGWKSPIYCDNRLTLSYPEIRTFIKEKLVQFIPEYFEEADAIAGVATAGIPHGVLVADALQKPFVYVRNEAKKHGLTNQIEGTFQNKAKIVVIEDLISTGMSSLQAVQTLRNAGAEIIGLAALFTYHFDVAIKAFQAADCKYYTLTDYPNLIQYALQNSLIEKEHEELLLSWRKNPEIWGI